MIFFCNVPLTPNNLLKKEKITKYFFFESFVKDNGGL